MICPVCRKIELYDERRICCLICWVSGRYMENVLSGPERENMIPRIRRIPGVLDVAVIHNGEGLFSVLVAFSDGRMLMPQAVMQMSEIIIDEEGADQQNVFMAVPAIPPQGAKWTIAVMAPGEEEVTYVPSEDDVEIPAALSDEELVEKMIEIAP